MPFQFEIVSEMTADCSDPITIALTNFWAEISSKIRYIFFLGGGGVWPVRTKSLDNFFFLLWTDSLIMTTVMCSKLFIHSTLDVWIWIWDFYLLL